MDLTNKYRPQDFDEVFGQKEAKACLRTMLKRKSVPHAILFTGPSGTGKTTLARIMARMVKCHPNDVQEVDSAQFRGIDTIRAISENVYLCPSAGKSRAWILDEVHQLPNLAQTALLKTLEEPPSHAYFFLCTTEPDGLIATLISRCTLVALTPLSSKDMKALLTSVCEKEEGTLSKGVIDRILEVSEGSARVAVKLVDMVKDLEDDEDREQAILSADVKKGAIDLCRVLCNPKSKWPQVAEILSHMEGEAESIRRRVLPYAGAILLKGGFLASKASLIITCMSDPFYEGGAAGRAKLTNACYEVFSSK